MIEVTKAIELHLADRGDHAVNSVSFSVGNDQHSRRVRRLDNSPRPKPTLIAGGGYTLPDEDDPWKTYAVQLLRFDGRTSTAGVYDSPTGKLPRVDDVILLTRVAAALVSQRCPEAITRRSAPTS